MRVTVITPPEPIVTWDEARAHLRLDEDDEQKGYVEGLIAVATAWLDGPAGGLGRALGVQTLEARFDRWPCPLRLPCPPEIEVVSVKYIDPAGIEQSWPISQPLFYDGLPSVRGREGDIRVQWRAGYAEGKIPAPIRHAILLMVSHLFNNRDAVSTTTAQPAQMPLGVEALVGPYRVLAV